ncbi:MAG TPA: hypothetical protein PKY77_22050 [Phycisphaerae bacterium]|nr:hypothetical protein [Phycisphaerae bacterium]
MAKVKCKLVGEDGNAFAIIGRVSKALKRAGMKDQAKEYVEKAMASPSYDALLALTLEYVEDEAEASEE